MTKAVLILKILITERKLSKVCETYDISYKYAHAISEEKKDPSLAFMRKITYLIPPEFWIEVADRKFFNEIEEAVKKGKKTS